MIEIDLIEDAKSGLPKKQLLGAVRSVLDKKDAKQDLYLSIVFITAAKMKRLNKKYRHKDKATDVLSFPADVTLPDGTEVRSLGDIFICPSYVADAAREIGVDFDEQVLRVLVHGVLHLLGYDHEKKDDEGKMLRLQERMLKRYMKASL